MTKSTITREQAQKIIVAADEVITALAGNNEDVHPDDSKKMCDLWDDLNDRYAPPKVVRELARMALAAMDSEPVEPIWGAKKYPVCRPVPGAKLIVWDETGKFIGYGSAVDTRESGVAMQISNGRRFDSNHDLRWQYALQPVPVVDSEPVDIPEMLTPVQASRAYCGEVRGYRDGWNACRAAMLQAEPVTTANKLGNSPVIPDTWIPVSERMPENDVSVLTFDGMYKRVHHAMYGHWQCWEPEKITHWMPLPTAPQEVKP